jgi:hypothetical protein
MSGACDMPLTVSTVRVSRVACMNVTTYDLAARAGGHVAKDAGGACQEVRAPGTGGCSRRSNRSRSEHTKHLSIPEPSSIGRLME